MKRSIGIIALLLCLVCISACSKTPTQTPAAPVEGMTGDHPLSTLTPPKDPDIVSELARAELMPADESSWIRELPVEMIMVHFCSNVVTDISNPYDLNAVRQTFLSNEVSINYIIDRDGTIYCWVPEQRVAWHAGKGEFGDEKYTNSMNNYSIGIELLAIGSKNDMRQYLTTKQYNSIPRSKIGFTDAQYASLIALISDISDRWGIPRDRQHVIGHDEYKSSKTDPGELFDWNRLMNGIA